MGNRKKFSYNLKMYQEQMIFRFRKCVSVAYYGLLFSGEILADSTASSVGVFSCSTRLTNFEEKHEKHRTIKPNVAIAFEASISRLPALQKNLSAAGGVV